MQNESNLVLVFLKSGSTMRQIADLTEQGPVTKQPVPGGIHTEESDPVLPSRAKRETTVY